MQPTPTKSLFRPGNIYRAGSGARFGLAGSLGLMALSKANQTMQSASYGQYGQAGMNALLAAGAGIGAYHTIMRTPQFAAASDTGVNLIRKNMQNASPKVQKMMGSHINPFIKGLTGKSIFNKLV